jgi:hypothetical protein
MTALETFKKAKAMLDAARAAAAEEIKPAIAKFAERAFAADEKIKTIRWRQYAPSFNDGEPCVFTVHDAYGYDEEGEEMWKGVNEQAQEHLNDLNELIMTDDGLMREAFGDGSEITIDRDLNVEVDDYYD